jgi:hypothetical protein
MECADARTKTVYAAVEAQPAWECDQSKIKSLLGIMEMEMVVKGGGGGECAPSSSAFLQL